MDIFQDPNSNILFGIYDSVLKTILTPTFNTLLEAQQDMELIVIETFKATTYTIASDIDELKDRIERMRKKPTPKPAPSKPKPALKPKKPAPKKGKKAESESESDSESESEPMPEDTFEVKYEEVVAVDELCKQLEVQEHISKRRYTILEKCKQRFKIVTFTLV